MLTFPSDVAPDTSNKLLVDIYGMMVNLSAKQAKIDTVKTVVQSNTSRIEDLESKIGDSIQVSIPRGIAIHHLPPPSPGTSELQQVRNVLAAVRAEGVDPQVDVVKAVREGFKAESRPGANDGWLGSVLVELKTKKNLEDHPNQMLKNLIIKNAKTKAEMRMERMANSLLKLDPHGQNFYFAANGNLRPRNQTYQPYQNSRIPRHPQPTANRTPFYRTPPQVYPPESYYSQFYQNNPSNELHNGAVTQNFQPAQPHVHIQQLRGQAPLSVVQASHQGPHHHAEQLQQGVGHIPAPHNAQQHQVNSSLYVAPHLFPHHAPQHRAEQPVRAPSAPPHVGQPQHVPIHHLSPYADPTSGSLDTQPSGEPDQVAGVSGIQHQQLHHPHQHQSTLQDNIQGFNFGDSEIESDQ